MNASPLHDFRNEQIDWNLSPEIAVTLYLEWGNNNWHAEHPPVRSSSDVATYFVVDNWQEPVMVRLVRRNSEEATDLISFPLPEPYLSEFKSEYGSLKAIYEPMPNIKEWLKAEMGQN